MAAKEPEVTISQLVDELETNSNGYTHVSRLQHSHGTNDNTVGFNRKYKIQDGGHKTGSNCCRINNFG